MRRRSGGKTTWMLKKVESRAKTTLFLTIVIDDEVGYKNPLNVMMT